MHEFIDGMGPEAVKFCEVLGIDSGKVVELYLNIKPGKPVTVQTKMLVERESLQRLTACINDFGLKAVPIDGD